MSSSNPLKSETKIKVILFAEKSNNKIILSTSLPNIINLIAPLKTNPAMRHPLELISRKKHKEGTPCGGHGWDALCFTVLSAPEGNVWDLHLPHNILLPHFTQWVS